MAYLGNIIRHLEHTFHIKVQGRFFARTEIEGLQFFNLPPQAEQMESVYAAQVLYIGDLNQLEALASEALPAKSNQNLLLIGCTIPPSDSHILYIQEPLDTAKVFNAIQEVIFSHYALKLKREELFQALHSDYGISGMTHVANTFLENPVTICDTSFSIIAASPAVNDTDHLEEKHGRLYLKDPLFQDMEDRNIIQHIYSSTVPYLTTIGQHPYKWVFQSIRIHHAVVGYICVRGIVRDFKEDDLEFINVFSQMLSIEMQKDSAYRHPTGLKYEYFLTELLEGHFNRTEYITDHLIQLGRTEMPFYTILLLKFTDSLHKPKQFKGYFDQLLSLLPNALVVLFHGDLTLLLPCDSKEVFHENCRNRFAAFLQLNRIQAFISFPYTDIAKSSIYYKQVKELSFLYEKTAHSAEESFVYYEAYFLEHGFCQWADTGFLSTSIHPDIIRMIEYDQTSNTEYASTLRIYLAQNRNALAAAKALHIHKSTFFYRLGKMSDLFGIDVNNGQMMFAYEYSFRVMDYVSKTYAER